MMTRFLAALLALGLLSCGGGPPEERTPSGTAPEKGVVFSPACPSRSPDPREWRLAGLRQLTGEGAHRRVGWDPAGAALIFQATRSPHDCDQIYTMMADGSGLRMVSSGLGRATGAFFLPGDLILYSSTHLAGESCPPPPPRDRGEIWTIDDHLDIFTARRDGTDLVRLTDVPGYDAEATVSPDGSRIVFTSDRSSDLEIYSMNLDGSGLRKLTEVPGCDGGASFSADGSRIVYRAHHPTAPGELHESRQLLREGLLRPGKLDLFVMNANGSGKIRVTALGGASLAPSFHPDGERIIFSSSHEDPEGRDFDLYLIGLDGTGLERITFTPGYDGDPVFSPDGKRLAFVSQRSGESVGTANIYLADWREESAPGAPR